jgi:hypothetical protein
VVNDRPYSANTKPYNANAKPYSVNIKPYSATIGPNIATINKHQNDKDAEMQPLLTIKKYLSATGDHLAIII